MKIAVCIKRVPEMDVKFKIASSGTAVDETGLKFDMSDFDGYAVEFALQTTEKLGAGEVTVISLGPDAVQETLRKALSMGAARAVHLKADSVPVDNFAVAQALAAELKDGGYDLILFGKHAADTASGAVGLMTAELLGMPMVQACTRLSFEGGKGLARREVEGGAVPRGDHAGLELGEARVEVEQQLGLGPGEHLLVAGAGQGDGDDGGDGGVETVLGRVGFDVEPVDRLSATHAHPPPHCRPHVVLPA